MSDLIDRQSAINALWESHSALDILYVDWVVNLLENMPSVESERKTFHVIDKTTGKEADPYEIALYEDWAKNLCYCDMEGFAILEDGTLILVDECGRFEYIQENDRFEIVWDEVTDER